MTTTNPTTKAPKPSPNLNDELWTNDHLALYFNCGMTTVINIKKLPGFPAVRQIAGLKRYPADQVRAFALAQQEATTNHEGEPA